MFVLLAGSELSGLDDLTTLWWMEMRLGTSTSGTCFSSEGGFPHECKDVLNVVRHVRRTSG